MGRPKRKHTRTSKKGLKFKAGSSSQPVEYRKYMRELNKEKQQYDYDWKGYGLELSERPTKFKEKVKTVFLQGEDASELHDQLEAATKNWQVNRLIEPYFAQ